MMEGWDGQGQDGGKDLASGYSYSLLEYHKLQCKRNIRFIPLISPHESPSRLFGRGIYSDTLRCDYSISYPALLQPFSLLLVHFPS